MSPLNYIDEHPHSSNDTLTCNKIRIGSDSCVVYSTQSLQHTRRVILRVTKIYKKI